MIGEKHELKVEGDSKEKYPRPAMAIPIEVVSVVISFHQINEYGLINLIVGLSPETV